MEQNIKGTKHKKLKKNIENSECNRMKQIMTRTKKSGNTTKHTHKKKSNSFSTEN